MTTIYLWGDITEESKNLLLKQFRMKWNRRKKRFFHEKCDTRALKKIMDFCLENRINYRTDD
ncbi:MAG: hypothetical protein NT045_02085, partial [Candidatus Aureabacteria bacterium]|nr:hypothetical protein [Candidatus Auribacterota bacterium]